jgi:hypothetical protein
MWYKIWKYFIEKWKKNCFVVNYFIWIVIKYDWCDIKSIKKLDCFLFDFFFKKIKIK